MIFIKMSKPGKANFKEEIKNCVSDMLILRSMLELSGSFKSRAQDRLGLKYKYGSHWHKSSYMTHIAYKHINSV